MGSCSQHTFTGKSSSEKLPKKYSTYTAMATLSRRISVRDQREVLKLKEYVAQLNRELERAYPEESPYHGPRIMTSQACEDLKAYILQKQETDPLVKGEHGPFGPKMFDCSFL